MYCSILVVLVRGNGGLYRISRVCIGAEVDCAVSVGLLMRQVCTVAYQ